MRKLLTTFAAASALALMASAAQADCFDSHNVTASKAPTGQTVSMSTYDGAIVPPAAEEAQDTAEAATPTCPDGDKECAGTEQARGR